ncbi:MAG: histidinol dehydrogenase [Gammaproteobacteria bacterium]|nr:histidinol dehydrogenase [Gammaproteobacteria bacterium]
MSSFIHRLDTGDAGFSADIQQLLETDVVVSKEIREEVARIVQDVREEGDKALIRYTNELDARSLTKAEELSADYSILKKAFSNLSNEDRSSLEIAAGRIRQYHEKQLEKDMEFSFIDPLGNRLGQSINPIKKVGIYVPGGQAAYPSSVLMTAIPASIAGVKEIVMTVPAPGNFCPDIVLAAAYVAEVDKLFTAGGAQAIAAMAYGTETFPRVDKIVGPGGSYVAAAKREVFGQVGIDLIAGPSELMIITDGSASPDWLVLDMFSQAEHDAAAQAVLVCPDPTYLDQIESVMRALLPEMERADVIKESLARRGALIRTSNIADCVALANKFAPEHLQLAVEKPRELVERIDNAGAVFLGARSPEVIGDYVAGPSHVLPTSGTARFSSPLGVYDFRKRTSVIELSEEGSMDLALPSAQMASREGLHAHAKAAQARRKTIDQGS